MNAENPIQIDLFGVSATLTKDTRLAEHIGGSGAAGTAEAGVSYHPNPEPGIRRQQLPHRTLGFRLRTLQFG